MRRDWFVTGTIVVVAAAIAVVYLSRVSGCEPSPSTGTSTCYSTAPWSLPIVLLVMGIGAAIMVFSIVPLRRSKAKRSVILPDEPIEGRLGIDDRNIDNYDFSQPKREPKGRSAARDLGAAKKFQRGEADFETAPRMKDDELGKTTPEEKRLRDWAARLAEREAALRAIEERPREQDNRDSQILALGRKPNPRIEREEIDTMREAAMAGILARLDTMERRVTRQETLTAREANPGGQASRDQRFASTERLEETAKRLAEELDLDGRDLFAATDSVLELARDLQSREAALRAELDEFIGGSPSGDDVVAREAVDAASVEPSVAELKTLEPQGVEPPPPKRIVAEPELELRPRLAPSPASNIASESGAGRAIEGAARIGVTKGVAVEHISEVLQAAKKAVRSARDVTEVREILERARASFDAGQYEEAMRQSDRILTLLRPTSADVRGGRVGPTEL